MYYTIGQRHGLGIGGSGEPWFAVGKDLEKTFCMLIKDSIIRFCILIRSRRQMSAGRVSLMDGGEMTCTAKFRYRQEDHKVTVKMTGDDEAEVIFDGQVRAVTPGQAVVFMTEKSASAAER